MKPLCPSAQRFASAAAAFRGFFAELREAFLERDAIFTQIELALLCREHVLLIGPPGTAKSAIAAAVVGRIVDDKSGAPSLFSRQLSESTVQTDLVGPVDFKVLTETGRTEHLTDEGMLGARHALLDEVFDGRDMLLRAILNVLHERELKHGRQVTAGKLQSAIMTSNRYLSEVLARSPELLTAFADRLSFVGFCPKSFAHAESRAAMLARAAESERPKLSAALTLQQLDVLQEAVESVEIPLGVSDGLERLAEGLERELYAQLAPVPDYVPTRYFSQRALVKALWALKAAVVRDAVQRRPGWRLVAQLSDLDALRSFFVLGGPSPEQVELLLPQAVDPRERAQLEIILGEHQAFQRVLETVSRELGGGRARERAALELDAVQEGSEVLLHEFDPDAAAARLRQLRGKLQPGPRYPEHRGLLVSAARLLAAAVEERLAASAWEPDLRRRLALLPVLQELVELCRALPEMRDRLAPVQRGIAGLCRHLFQELALAAEALEFEAGVTLDSLAEHTRRLGEDLASVANVARGAAWTQPVADELDEAERSARTRASLAIRRCAPSAISPAGDLFSESSRLEGLEQALALLGPEQPPLRPKLLAARTARHVREALERAPCPRIEALTRVVQMLSEELSREGWAVAPLFVASREVIDRKLRAHAAGWSLAAAPPLEQGQSLNGEAYRLYRQAFRDAPEGQLGALALLEAALPPAAEPFVAAELKRAVALAELGGLEARASFLRTWFSLLARALPAPQSPRQAEIAFDRLVQSRFPFLATREGELARLRAALGGFSAEAGELGERARSVMSGLQRLAEEFSQFSRRILDARES